MKIYIQPEVLEANRIARKLKKQGCYHKSGRFIMKTICTSSSMPNLAIIQISRDCVLRNYRPSRASWKRFIKVYLTDNLQKQYKTFRVLTSAGFKAG